MDYARGGWPIFPLHTLTMDGCSCGDSERSRVAKHPRILDWQHAASSNPETVAGWWTKFPDANIGLSLDGLCCLDIDPRHGGEQSLIALEQKHAQIARVALQRSGSGGTISFSSPQKATRRYGAVSGLG